MLFQQAGKVEHQFTNCLSPETNKLKKFKVYNYSGIKLFESPKESKEKQEYSPFVIKTGLGFCSDKKQYNLTEKRRRTISNKIYSPLPNTSKSDKLSDRFIPMNKGINLMEKFNLAKRFDIQADENVNQSNIDTTEVENNLKYNLILKQNALNENLNTSLFNQTFTGQNISDEGKIFKSNIFSFRQESKPKQSFFDSLMNRSNQTETATAQILRKINPKPYKVLNAPNLLDDFYLNLLDWSSKNDIAVGLGNTLGLWCTNQTQESILCTYERTPQKYVSSVIWSESGDNLAVGTSQGQVEIYDGKKYIILLYYSQYTSTIKCLSRT